MHAAKVFSPGILNILSCIFSEIAYDDELRTTCFFLGAEVGEVDMLVVGIGVETLTVMVGVLDLIGTIMEDSAPVHTEKDVTCTENVS